VPEIEVGNVDGVAIRGGATAFPSRRVTNEEALRLIGARMSPESLQAAAAEIGSSLGVLQRAWAQVPGATPPAEGEESTRALAVSAARKALDDAGVAADDVSLILCATSTPSGAGVLAGAVGTALGTRCAALDIRGGCAAAVFGLATGALHVHAGCGPVLLVGAETFTRVVPAGHQVAALALADGAGALVLTRGRGRLRGAALATDGGMAHLLPDGPPDFHAAALAAGAYFLSADPEELTDEIPSRYHEALNLVLARAGIAFRDLDLYVPHQSSRPLIHDVCRRTGIALDRAFVNVDQHANVGVAGWLVALVEARATGKLRPGARVALAAVGGGLSSAAALIET
jgi:3-oxoacyl-[acyl-carrier-protein] synthase-3